jgi:adenylate cyclase, class 2
METEIKLRVENPDDAHRLLVDHGFGILHARVFERNLIFDTPDFSLRSSGRLLRLRAAGGTVTLTFKGPGEAGKHKSREEHEVHPDSFGDMETILKRLGYQVTFEYDKHRTEYHRPGVAGTATIDETPAGTFMELEGEPDWIDRTAAELGFHEADYILASYATLYVQAAASAKSGPAETAPGSPPEP